MSRFPILSTISILLKVVAVITLLVGLIAGFAQGSGGMIVTWITSVIGSIVLWAYAEIISVALAIEENTYNTHRALLDLGSSRSLAPSMQSGQSPFPSPAPSHMAPSPAQRGGAAFTRSLSLANPYGHPGALVHGDVRGFPSGAVVDITWIGPDGTSHPLAKVNANPNGQAAIAFAVPEWETEGLRQVQASASRGPRATTAFTVNPRPS